MYSMYLWSGRGRERRTAQHSALQCINDESTIIVPIQTGLMFVADGGNFIGYLWNLGFYSVADCRGHSG